MKASIDTQATEYQGKTAYLRQRLSFLGKELGPGARYPKVRELAQSLSVSLSTLDRVLEDMERDGQIVRKPGHGIYVPEGKAAATIAYISGVDPFDPRTSPAAQLLLGALREELCKSGRNFKFYMDPAFDKHGMPSREELVKDIGSGLLSGAVFVATRHVDDLLWLNSLRFPYIGQTDCPYAKHRYYLDYPWLASQALEELVKRGSKRVALIPWNGPGGLDRETKEAFLACAGRLGVASGCVVWDGPGDGSSDNCATRAAYGFNAAMKLFENAASAPLDGIVCPDDTISSGVIPALMETGLGLGRDVLLASHCNKGSPVLGLYLDRIIKFELDFEPRAQEMLKALDALVSGEDAKPFARPIRPELKS